MRTSRRAFLGLLPAAGLLTRFSPRAVKAETDDDDPLGLRGDFPLTREEIYFNTAYMSLIPTAVEQAGLGFVRSKARGPVSLGDMLARTDKVRKKFARLVGADVEEIGFLYATSEGENVVTHSLNLRPGDNVVVDELHYMTSYVLYRHLEKTAGIELRIAPSVEGAAPPEVFEPLVDGRTRLVSVAWVSHQNGFRHDVRALAELAHAQGAYLYTDAVQAVGMFPMNLHEQGVDFMTSGTYKWLLAGYGVAPFYVRRELLELIPPDRMGALHVEKELGDHRYRIYDTAKKYEYATLAFGAVYQLGAALDYLEKVGLDRIERHTVGLASKLRRGLVEHGFQVLTPEGNRSSIVSFVNKKDPQTATRVLEQERIRLSLREKGRQIRVGPALFNNTTEVDRFLEVVKQLA